MKFVSIILAFAISLMACGEEENYIHIDHNDFNTCNGKFVYNKDVFTFEQERWIEESGKRWNEWVGYNLIDVSEGRDSTCTITVGNLKAQAIGEEWGKTGNIFIDVDKLNYYTMLNKDAFEAVVIHEIGHALGYNHVGEPGKALMSTTLTRFGSFDFTDIDRVQCIEKGMCQALTSK